MVLYTCAFKGIGAPVHPCGLAKHALDEAGQQYELKTVKGFKNVPFTTGGDKRDEVRRLSGQGQVPILVLDDDSVIAGSKAIRDWAKAHPAG